MVATDLFKTMKKSILLKLQAVEQQISVLSERLYQPQITPSDQREIVKRKKKLEKEKSKLIKKLNTNVNEST
jgi:hypothetical protein